MCKSVLNDEWVSHPSFASDDGAWATVRKSPFEDALHRTEEERHEYDFHLDALARTIAALEPLAQRLAHVPLGERAAARVKTPLAGAGKALHARVVRKVYGRAAGADVLKALHETPALAVPVVLARLRQKEDEWKRARAAWARVWREVDARAYPRSLDRRAADARAADKKACTPRALVVQIEAARAEARAQRGGGDARGARGAHLRFALGDAGVLQDALKLCFGLLDRAPGMPLAERKKAEAFLRAFVPTLLGVDARTFNAGFGAVRALVEDDAPAPVPKARRGAGDLRKRTLAREAGKRKRGAGAPTPPRTGSPALDPRAMLADAAVAAEAPAPPGPPRRYVFFANAHFYVLLRLLEVGVHSQGRGCGR
jgi:paired amphipathic helix protein Sin3a